MLYQMEFYDTANPETIESGEYFYYTIAEDYPKQNEFVSILTKGVGYTKYKVKEVEFVFSDKDIQPTCMPMSIIVEKC